LPAQSTPEGVGETGARASSLPLIGDGEEEVREDLPTSPGAELCCWTSQPRLSPTPSICSSGAADAALLACGWTDCGFAAADVNGGGILA